MNISKRKNRILTFVRIIFIFVPDLPGFGIQQYEGQRYGMEMDGIRKGEGENEHTVDNHNVAYPDRNTDWRYVGIV
jgi:hypothetical protein